MLGGDITSSMWGMASSKGPLKRPLNSSPRWPERAPLNNGAEM